MTINKYYHTFGFLVPIDDCIALLGYTPDKLTEEIRRETLDNLGYDEEDVEDTQGMLRLWFESDSLYNYGMKRSFVLDDVKYVVRSFCHDEDNYNKNLVVGVSVAEIDRFSGSVVLKRQTTENNPKKLLIPLAQHSDWKTAIQKVPQCYSGSQDLWAIPEIKYTNLRIHPAIYTTTDDCSCCS